jgi:glycosyltransferase involved in cell wall biosynthesis
MRISIITATYNSEKTINDTLESINSQKYNDIEHIIIDSNSSDKTLDIIDSFSYYKIVKSEPDDGIYDAMNKGIKLSNGEVIGLLNSDDLYFDKHVLGNVMNEFISDSTLDLVYGNLLYVKKNNISTVVRKWISLPFYDNFFEHGNVPPHPTLFVRKRVYDEIGLFDLRFKLAADYELMLRLFKKHNLKSKYLNTTMVLMRLGGATNKNIFNVLYQNIEILKAWKKNELRVPFYLMPFRFFKRISQYLFN